MNLQQILLVCISSILLTIAVYYFTLSILISSQRTRYLYFSLSTFGGSMFVLFALLLTYPNIPEKILMYQRLRIIGLMICASAWIFCMYDIYFKHSIVPKVNLLVTLLFAALVPTPVFLSLPIRDLTVEFIGVPFQYHFASTNPAYSLYALCLIGVFCYSIVRVALCKNPPVSRTYGLMAFLPSIIGGIHDFAITHDIIRNIMISDYLFFGFLMSVFVLFIREEQQNYLILQKLTLGLEDEILTRTEALRAANEQLKQEIDERKKAEEQLFRSKNDLRSILDCINSGFMLVDPETHRIVDVNTYALDMIGAARDQVINQGCHQFVCPAEIGKCPVTDLRQTVNVSERILINAQGARIPILKSVTQVELQNRTYLIESFIDITERKASGEKLREAKEQLEKYLENSIDPIIAGDSVGCVVKPNKAFLEMTGFAEEEIIGEHIYNLSIVGPGTYESTTGEVVTIMEDFHATSYAGIARLLEEGKVSDWESYYIHKSGKLIPITQNVTLIYSDRGEVTGSFSIIRDLTGQKNAEKALRISEARFRAIAESSIDAIVTSDNKNILTFCNHAAEKMFGYSKEELIGQPGEILLPARLKDRNKTSFQRALQKEIPQLTGKPIEACGLKKDNQEFPIETSVTAYKIDDKLYFTSTIHDITERKLAEDEIRKSKEFLEVIFKTCPDIIMVTDAEGTISSVNAAAEKILGYTPEELIGSHSILLAPEEEYSRQATSKMLHALFEQGFIINHEFYWRKKNGGACPLECSAVMLKDDAGNDLGAVSFARDITERKKAEGERVRLSTVIEQAEEAIIITDEKGIIQYCNAATWRKSGIARAAIIGTNLFFPAKRSDAEKLLKGIWEMVSSGSIWKGRLKNRTQDGSCVELDAVITPVKDASGKIINYVSVSRDVTREVQLEQQLAQSQKMEAIGILAGGVAHDLNNILSAMVGYPDLLLLNLPEDSPIKQPLLSIKSAGERAAAIVNDMLTLARRGVSVSEAVPLNAVITEYLGSQQHEKLRSFHPGVEFEISLAPDLLNTIGSPVHLSKVVMNLVSNAAEAMPEGGKIIVATENRYLDKPIKGYEKVNEGDCVVLTVQDNGVGISKEDMSRIFEPFYTKKVMGRSGTGLGLAVVWGTVKDSDGYIVVDSTPGRGTAFTLYFPATRQETEAKKKELPIGHYSGNGEHILVVDDLETQRDIASSMLKRLNYQVETAASGEEAIEHLKTAAVDLVILDMIMDPGIDGFETYRRILEIRPNQKAIIASGFSETDRVNKAQQLGAGAYIKKPYTLENLGMAVKAELAK